MSELFSPAFNEQWRKSGFFPAIDQVPPTNKAKPSDFRSLNSRLIRDHITKIRKELAKATAALERIEQNTRSGLVGGKIDQAKLEQDVVALAGWVASAVNTVPSFTYYVSEPSHVKAHRMMEEQMDFPAHASRSQF
jgi:hypothetical protein